MSRPEVLCCRAGGGLGDYIRPLRRDTDILISMHNV